MTLARPTPATPTAHSASAAVERRRVDPRRDEHWAALMEGPRGSLFGAPPWIAAIVDTYGFEVSADVLVAKDGNPAAGFVHAELNDIRGHRVASLPFCDRLDPVVDTDDQWHRLLEATLALELPIELRVLEAEPPRRDPRFQPATELAWHATDLDRPEAEILAGFHKMARRNIRAAARGGVNVRFGADLADVQAFHELHRLTRKRKYHLLAQPIEFFERIWKRFAPLGKIVIGLASHQGEVIAGNLCLIWNDVIYYKFGASISERLALRPNDLLAWESMLFGRERGCRRFDWGVSDLDQPGLVFYKQKYATEERRVLGLRHTPGGFKDSIGRDVGCMFSQLTQLLTRDDVPNEVTQRAGEILYRYFC
jgi:CelD/BcsL family acetyltransferase involved in cellulose biosynthesis